MLAGGRLVKDPQNAKVVLLSSAKLENKRVRHRSPSKTLAVGGGGGVLG